jgi:hypothetical protein|tara:strand:+ start:213 stop:2363 length:2151 start_codon:yes stop_codon:yes gene_type:complete
MATTKITSPDLFDLGSLNTALQLPSGTTAERPASPSTGEWRYNTTTNLVEYYDGAAWRDLQSEEIPPIPSENFNTVLWTGNGTGQSITGVGFAPDFVWLKARNLNNYGHRIFDTSRGALKKISPSSTGAESTDAGSLTSFDSDGFTLGNDNYVNNNGDFFVGWTMKANGGITSSNTDGTITSTVQANQAAGFSIVEYTADGTNNTTIGHGLGAAPEFILIKKLTSTGDWITHHQAVGTGNFLYLNRDDAQLTQAGIWSNINSTTFNLISGYNDYNQSGQDYIAYCFAPKAQYSKFGSYTGNGSTDGTIVETGFEPAFLLIKRVNNTADWVLLDNKRTPSNPRNIYLEPNTNDAEVTSDRANFLTNGFQLITTGANVNFNGDTYIYIAFASDPSAAPTLTNSFNISLYSGNSSTQAITGLGFKPDWVWIKERGPSAENHNVYDTARGPLNFLTTNSTASQNQGPSRLQSFDSDGFTLGSDNEINDSGSTYVAWCWKANPLPTVNTEGTQTVVTRTNLAAGFSIVTLPDFAGTQNIGHGLDGVPDLIIMKQYTGGTGSWATYNSQVGERNWMNLNTNGSNNVATPGYEFDSVTATTITNLISNSNYSYIYYCFKSVPGYSKVGTYTGNGSSSGPTITTGFEPSFLMLKRIDDTGSWAMLDNKRSPSNPRDKELFANITDAENTFTAVDFSSTGFQIINTSNTYNANGSTYLYVTFKEI